MSDVPHGAAWWQASDDRWYPPELRPGQEVPDAAPAGRAVAPTAAAPRRAVPRQAVRATAPSSNAPAPRTTPPTASPVAAARSKPAPSPAVQSPAATPAPAAEASSEVLLELRGSALTSDLDRIGDRLVVYEDRVEQRGRGNKHRGTMAMATITSVEVERTHKGQWLHIVGGDGEELIQQGLEAGPAEAARAQLVKLAGAAGAVLDAPAGATPSPAAAPVLDVPEQIRKLAELHEHGILTDVEFQTKKQELLDRL